MLKARTRIPLLMWILLLPILMVQTISVNGSPDSPNNGRNLSNFPTRPAAAAAAAAAAAVGVVVANQPSANNESTTRSKPKRDYNELKKRKKGLGRKRKKSSYDYGLARSSLELDPTANSQQVRNWKLLSHFYGFSRVTLLLIQTAANYRQINAALKPNPAPPPPPSRAKQELKADKKALQKDLAKATRKQERDERKIAALKTDVSELNKNHKHEISALKTDVSELNKNQKLEIAALKTDVSELNKDQKKKIEEYPVT